MRVSWSRYVSVLSLGLCAALCVGQTPPAQIDGGLEVALELDGGQLRFWGYDLRPYPPGSPNPDWVRTPTVFPGANNFTAISAGQTHALALDAQGVVYGGGSNSLGEAGLGTQSNWVLGAGVLSPFPTVPLQVATGLTGTFVGIEACIQGGFAWRANGTVVGWGANRSGRLVGISATRVELNPVAVPIPAAVIDVVSSYESNLALDDMGQVWEWGLAPGDTVVRAPYVVQDLPAMTAIAHARTMSLGLDASGNVWAWGYIPALLPPGAPVAGSQTPGLRMVSGLPAIQSISGGNGNWYCLDTQGNVWGFSSSLQPFSKRQAGFGVLDIPVSIPRMLPDLSNIVHVASDGDHGGYARDDAGRLWAFGHESRTGLGLGASLTQLLLIGSSYISPRPQLVDIGPGVPSIASTGTPCGRVPRFLESSSLAGLGSEVNFRVLTSLPAYLFLTPGAASPTGWTPFPGCTVWLDETALVQTINSGVGPYLALPDNPATGAIDATWLFRVADDPSLTGLSFSSQALIVEPGSATPALTNALTHVIN